MNAMDDEENDKLRSAIEKVIGPSPYVLVYDSTLMDDLLEGGRCNVSYAEPALQAPYTSVGLLKMGTDAYGALHEEES